MHIQQNIGSLTKSDFVNHLVLSTLTTTQDGVFMKICKIHGELSPDKIVNHKRNGKFSLECHECVKSYHLKSYQKQKKLHEENIKNNEYKNFIPKKTCSIHGVLSADQIQVRGKYKKCRLCMGLQCRKWEKKNRKKVLETRRIFYSKNKIKYRKKSVLKNKEISLLQYEELLKNQNNKCYICGLPETKKFKGELISLSIDHNHKSGKVRKLLCHHCNTGIGHFKEDTSLMKKAIEYIIQHEECDNGSR